MSSISTGEREKEAGGSVLGTDSRYRAFFFGPFCVTRDGEYLGEPVWRRKKARTLLQWFLLNAGQFFPISQLSTLCWPDIEQAAAIKNLHVTLHYLRHLLEPDLAPGQASSFIRRNKQNAYRFDLNDHWWIDLFEIKRIFASAGEEEGAGHFTAALADYRAILAYYQQGFLPEEIYNDFFASYRRRYDFSYTRVFEKLLQLSVLLRRPEDVISYGLQALAVDPSCEFAVKAMVQVHLEMGNVASALRTLDTFQERLRQELGIEYGEELRSLRATILYDYA